MTTIVAPAPVVPIDQLVQRFTQLVETIRAAPNPDVLRQLELLAQQIMARSRELGPAALVLLQRAVGALIGILTAPATVIIVGTTVGTLGLWWLFLQILNSAMSGVPDFDAIAAEIASNIAIALSKLGVPLDNDCIKRLANEIADLLRDFGPTYPFDFYEVHFDEILRLYLKCVYGDLEADDLFDDADDVFEFLMQLIKSLLKDVGFFAVLFGLTLGGSKVEAGELDDLNEEKVKRIARKLGLKGIPRGDGFALEETPEGADEEPCDDDEELNATDVEVIVETPLGAFSDADLEKRKAALERWIAELDAQIAKDRAALRELERNPENDTAKADLLRLRIEINNREAERLRKALQNTQHECQIRELREAR